MKNWKLKKTGCWTLLVIFLLTAVFSMTGLKLEAFAAVSDFTLSHSVGTLSTNQEFSLNSLNLKNSTGKSMTVIKIDFDGQQIVRLKNGSTEYLVNKNIANNTDEPLQNATSGDINMIFIGDGSSGIVPVTITCKLDGEAETTVSKNLSFLVQKPTEEKPSTPVDTTKYKPVFQASISGYDTVTAGTSNTVRINLKNVSTNAGAKNIVFLPPAYDKASPFTSVKATSKMPIANIQYGESAEMTLSFDVDKYAENGVYPFTFKLTYANPFNDEFSGEYTVFLKISSNQSKARLNVYIPDNKTVSAIAGGNFTLPLLIFNEGTLATKDVKVTLAGLAQDTFMLSSGTGRNEFGRIEGLSNKEVAYTIKAASALKSGSYPITIKLEYYDEKGNKTSDEQQVWIPVAGNEDRVSALELLEIKPSKTTVKPGESFEVAVKVKNSGDFDARQIKISADGTTSLMPVSQNLYIVPTLKKGETKNVIFRFQPQPEAARGSVPITIKVESVDTSTQNSAISQAVSVFVDSTSTGKPEAGKNVPKIIVKNYSSEPTLVKAGEHFTLNLEFLNTHASKTVRNIKGNFVVTESSNETGNVFSPVDCSNTFYIDEITPKNTVDWTLTLFTIPDAKSKTYTVTISFEYEDDSGNPYKADEIIGIPVYQPSRFEISEFSIPPENFMGQPIFFGFEMYNMGKTEIYNVKLSVEGNFEAQPKSNYFGNFESGRREYFELNIIPMAVGPASGRILFQYETASGEKQELVKELSFNVGEMPMPPEGDMPVDGKPMEPGMEKANKGFFGSTLFFIILGVVVLAGVVVVILVIRKRKKSKEFDF